MKFTYTAALVALSLTACSVTRTSAPIASMAGTGIIGGDEVASTDPISGMTAMLVDTNQGALCTASILNQEWLLTAAHCVADADAKDLVVVLSGTFQDLSAGNTPKKDIKHVKETKVYPKYAETMAQLETMAQQAKAAGKSLDSTAIDGVKDWGDLALVHVTSKMPNTKAAATLLPASITLTKNETVTLAGYGQQGTTESSAYGDLRRVDVSISEPVWGTTEVLMDNHVKGACHGDSGGPAYVTVNGVTYLFGITSRGVGDSNTDMCDHFSAYTNAANYRDWIASNVGQLQ